MKTTITDKAILLTKKGMRELKRLINQLEHDKKKALQLLREVDRTTSRDERLVRIERLSALESIDSELAEKKSQLASAKLISGKRSHLRVAIGSVVDLIDKHGHLFRFKIVDSIEADPSDGRISTESPLGRNLIGKTVQDTISWSRGNYFNQFQLVRIF